jgi:hypothetical protein
MSEQVNGAAAENISVANQAPYKPTQNQQQTKRQNTQAVSDPREIATLIMARMNVVNARKDELTIAIKGLTDITQQLAGAYAEQVLLIERLANRVKTLEARAGGNGANPPAAAQGNHAA